MFKNVSKVKISVLFILVVGLVGILSDAAIAMKPPYWTEKDPTYKKTNQAKVDALNETMVSLAQNLSSAVVTVLTTSEVKVQQMDQMFDFFFGPQMRPRQMPRSQKALGLGSGFVINADGLIVTNSHVVRLDDDRLADSVRVGFFGDSSKSLGEEVEVVGIDPIVDTAVLRLKNKPKRKLSVIPLGNSDTLKVGEWVVAIGNPHGLSHSVTKGIVSALGRGDIIPEISSDFIQTDASINQGNSGGPLINLMGEVIGINTAIDPKGQGLGFAIPINVAKRAIKGILEKGHASHGFAGVSLYPNFDADAAKSLGLVNAEGALIEDVAPGQPAAKAGLKSYDVVTKVGSRKISTNTEFQRAIRELDPQTEVAIEYLRDGKSRTTKITLGDLDKNVRTANFSPNEDGDDASPQTGLRRADKAGISISDLTPEIRARWKLGRVQGVVVNDVAGGSAADRAGLARGDILIEIQKQQVSNSRDVARILSRSGTYILKVLRGPSVALFTIKI